MIYYTVENSGWSGGISWFESGGTHMNPLRLNSKEDAESYIRENRWDDASVLWRIVRHEFTRKMEGFVCVSDTHVKEYFYVR